MRGGGAYPCVALRLQFGGWALRAGRWRGSGGGMFDPKSHQSRFGLDLRRVLAVGARMRMGSAGFQPVSPGILPGDAAVTKR
jgi:hypothetical protein